MSRPILVVEGLTRRHGPGCPQCLAVTGREGNLCPQCRTVVALAGAGFVLHPGEILGVMGESGSGKSTLVRLLHLDDRPDQGAITYHDLDSNGRPCTWALPQCDAQTARWLRNRRFGMVYQNPQQGLNFQVTAGGNIAERLLMAGCDRYETIRVRALELLARTEIPAGRIDHLPGGFSGGMQQRLQIARALAPRPQLLLLDEITTGLDLSVQARILDLVREIQHRTGVSMIVVTHDLGVVRLLADRTLILRHGRIVEAGLTDQILEDPQHPYTQQLVASAL